MRVPVELPTAERLRFAAREYGEREVAERAARALLTGREDDDFLRFLGGTAAESVIAGHGPRYWVQAWSARALEHVWDPSASDEVITALGHEQWRVRVAAARVCAVRGIPAADRLTALAGDAHWRVRDATAWALGRVATPAHTTAIAAMLADEEPRVASRADRALDELAARSGSTRDELLAEASVREAERREAEQREAEARETDEGAVIEGEAAPAEESPENGLDS